jgi:hypothetical protein
VPAKKGVQGGCMWGSSAGDPLGRQVLDEHPLGLELSLDLSHRRHGRQLLVPRRALRKPGACDGLVSSTCRWAHPLEQPTVVFETLRVPHVVVVGEEHPGRHVARLVRILPPQPLGQELVVLELHEALLLVKTPRGRPGLLLERAAHLLLQRRARRPRDVNVRRRGLCVNRAEAGTERSEAGLGGDVCRKEAGDHMTRPVTLERPPRRWRRHARLRGENLAFLLLE